MSPIKSDVQGETPAFDESTVSHKALLTEIEELRLQVSKLQKEMKTTDARLAVISQGLHIGFWERDEVKQEVVRFTDEMAVICGMSLEDLYSCCKAPDGFTQIIHPQDVENYRQHTCQAVRCIEESGQFSSFDYRIVMPDQSIRYVHELVFGSSNDEGKVTRSFGVLQDVTEYQQAVEALQQSDRRYLTLFDQLPVGIEEEDYSAIKKVVDKLRFKGVDNILDYLQQNPKLLREMVGSSRITDVNQALLDIHQADSKEAFLKGETDIDDWWDAEWVTFYAAEIDALARGEKYFDAERIDTRLDDSYFETRTITTIVKGHEDDWARVITIHEDITERKNNEANLVEARTLAEKASKAKSEFLSSMSHELRTPLNAIQGFSQLFEYDSSLSEQQRTNALEINRAGKHLLVLIDEILDLSRIESGEIELSLEPVSLFDVVNDSLNWIEGLIKTRQVKFKLDQASLNSVLVQADSIRLKQVFLNLFTNAVKYNRKGGSVSLEIEALANSRIRIGVRDTGPGISRKKLGELFQPFNRLGAEFSGTEGTGIGLVITQQLVELMQGSLDVESVEGRGTTFWVSLNRLDQVQNDYIRDITEVPTITEMTSALKSPQPYILVAEDNAVNRELMAAQLEFLGYQVNFAVDGVEALKMWQSGKYYLLLTDIRMPNLNGYDLIREVRAIDITGSHPVSIIAITANAMEADIEQCYAAGADDVISKPVEIEALRQALEKWVPKEVAEKQQTSHTAIQRSDADSAIDIEVLIKSVGDKADTHRSLLGSFARSLDEAVGHIEDAFSWRNHQKVVDAAHKLKSSSKSMGAVKLAELCQSIESAALEKNWPELDSIMPLLLRQVQQVEEAIKIHSGANNKVSDAGRDYSKQSASVKTNGLTVLMVDDDFVMHRVTTTILNDLDISNVYNAMSGPQALEMIGEIKEEIDLIICDLNMPGMDGIEFMRHLARQHFTSSLILTSGEDIRILRTVEKLAIEHELQVLGIIEKPVTPAKLIEMLEAFEQIQSEGTMIMTDLVVLDELRYAIKHEQIDVFFQPKVDLKKRQVVGLEALVRWRHPTHGLIRPDAFITMAEENQLINELTRLVCKVSIAYAGLLKARNIDLNIAINISVDALNDLEWPDIVSAQVNSAGLEPSMITFEITESRLMEHISVALDILSRLSLKRFNLSIDDFGTGYSSMEQLQRIPFSELKIDRAFVNGAASDSAARAILESSVLLAKKLDMKVVAEGVENQQDLDLLESLEVDQVQGYFYSRPLPFDELLSWLEGWHQEQSKH